MRKFIKRKALYCLTAIPLLLLVLAIGTFAVAFAPTSNLVASAALSATDVTLLQNGTGLQYGSNALRTTTDDFYSDGSGTVSYSSSGISLSGTTALVTKPGMMSGSTSDYENLESNASVYYALYDPDISVTFRYEFMLSGKVTSPFDITVSLYYSNSINESGKVESTVQEETFEANVTDSYSAVAEIETTVEGRQILQGKPHIFAKITFDAGSDTLVLSKPSVTVSAESAHMQINKDSGVQLTISGPNRTSITIDDVYDPEGLDALNQLYVKAGDTISLKTSVEKNSNGSLVNQTYGTLYAAGFGRMGSSCVDWYTYYNSNYGSNRTYLERVEDEQNIVYPDGADPQREYKINAYNGFVANFKVTSGVTNATTLEIVPRMIESYDGQNYTYFSPQSDSDVADVAIVLNVDNKAPTAPKLDATTSLGYAIDNKLWFTDSYSFNLIYDENTINGASNVSDEQVYAFVVDKSMLTVPTGYDFTPGSDALYNYVASAQNLVTRRQELGAFNNGGAKNKIDFSEYGHGEYGLVLYAIDGAGNVSSPTLYTVAQGLSVKVDWRQMNVGIDILYGNNLPIVPVASNRDEFQKYCSVYVYIGDAYHDENGLCTQDPSDNPTSNMAVTSYKLAKRGSVVTVRVVMDSTQAYNYSFVRLGADYLEKNNPEYVVDRFGNMVFDHTYKLNDDIWEISETSSDRQLNAYFHRRVDLKLLEEDFTFSYIWGNAERVEIADKIDAYFKDDTTEQILIQPEIAVEYFKPMTITVESEYTREGSSIVLNGKGVITINGVNYQVDSSDLENGYDLNAFGRGEITFVTGQSEYQVMNSLLHGYSIVDGVERVIFELTAYDKNAGRTEGFVDAGTYYYRAYVVAGSSTFYYGELTSSFTIKKAEVGVIDAFAKNDLIYGESMDQLVFASYDKTGVEIPQSEAITFGGVTYQKVDSGVYGRYTIRVPQIGSADYVKHSVVDNLAITVEFQPMDLASLTKSQIEENYSVLQNYFNVLYNESTGAIVGYELKEGTQTATNYNVQTLIIPINIKHRTANLFAVADTLETYYDGYEKSVSAYVLFHRPNGQTVELPDIPVIIEYKLFEEGEGSYTTTLPVSAGQYSVRMKVDETLCNFMSDYVIETLFIYPRELEVTPSSDNAEYSTMDQEVIVEGVATDHLLTYTYSHTSTATYISGYRDSDDNFVQVPGILYTYSFLKYAYYNQDSEVVSIDSPAWSEPMDLVGGSSLDAGLYLMEVTVNNLNNAGTLYVIVDVKQVRRGDSASLNISTPSAQTSYQTVNLDGSSNGKTGHLEFGQTLKSMQSYVLGRGGSAKFTPRGATSAVSISSRFIFETEENYVTRTLPTLGYTELLTNGYGEKVLPVKFDEGGRVAPYSIMVIWQAGTTDEEGNFTPDYNFRSELFEVTIYVVRATADFSGFRLSNLTYGQKVGEATFEGTITSHGYEFAESDFTITVPEETKGYTPLGGENQVLCSFTPSESLIRKYLPLNNQPIALTVEKRQLEVVFPLSDVNEEDYDGTVIKNVVTHVYGSTIVTFPVTLNPIGFSGTLSTSGVVTQSFFLKAYSTGDVLQEGESLFEYENTTFIKLVGITDQTPVGQYFVYTEVLSTDQNFFGSGFSQLYVIRAELFYDGGSLPEMSIEYSENLNSVDFGNVLVANDPYGNYNKFFRGTFRLAVKDGEGNFIYDFLPQVTLDNSTYNVYVVFFPEGSPSVLKEYEDNFRPYEVEYFLEVKKRDLADTFQVSGLIQVFNDSEREISVVVPDPVDGTKTLPTTINYLTDHRYAGAHQVEIILNEQDNYTGYLLVTMIIERAPITITDDVVRYVYNATPYEYAPKYEVPLVEYQNVTFDFGILYKDYLGNQISSAPIAVGMYYAEVTLMDDNFYASKTVTLLVTPSYSGFNGLEQTYFPPTADESIQSVAPNYNQINVQGEWRDHPSVNYSVRYKESGLSDENYLSTVPTDAGQYTVKFTFNERGYNEVFLLDMVILKREAVFYLNDTYYRSYTSEEVVFGVLLPESVTKANYFFKGEGDADYSETKPINAGSYSVMIELVDNNYRGVGYTTLVIEKANLQVSVTPVVSSTIEFNTPSSEITFLSGSGVVIFPLTAEDVTQKGTFIVKTEIENFRVGTHNVEIAFLPDDSQNFNEAVTTMNLNVVQRNIASFIAVEGAVYNDTLQKWVVTTEYISERVGVSPYLTDDAPIATGYTDVVFSVKYNNVNTAPINVGDYNVSITVSDQNYSGNMSNVLLRITHATPVIVMPKINDILLGTVLDNSYIADNSGGAYVGANGKTIPGSFVVQASYRVAMMLANEQEIGLTFVPADRDNVAEYNFATTINVIGEDVNLSDSDIIVTPVSGGTVYYGAPLSSYSISLSEEKASLGTVSWVDPDKILHVGEKAEYLFTPTNTDTHNKRVYSTTKAVINKATFMLGDSNSVVLYEGDALRDTQITLSLFNAEYPDLKVEGYSLSLSADNLDYVATSADIGKYLSGVTLKVTVIHPDYDDTTNNTFEFSVYVKRKISEFSIANTVKYYDGEIVSIEDLGITVVGTDYQPSKDELVFKSIMLGGNMVSEIREAGEYTVTVAIDEKTYEEGGSTLLGSHEGEVTFTYIVLKRDITDSMALEGNEMLYAEPQSLSVSFVGYESLSNNDVTFTYYSENKSTLYGALPPTDAGSYIVVVAIKKDNPYYVASKEFSYLINKRVATVTLDSSYNYTYNPAQEISIVPEISNNVSAEYVQIMYYPMGNNSGTTVKPQNVGTYRVVVSVVNHPNLTGRAETTLNIRQANVIVTTPPTVEDITYGVMLKHAGIIGGVAEITTGESIGGTFTFQNPEDNTLPVGVNSVQMIFTPTNSNYAPTSVYVSVRVIKATIGVEFGALSKFYTGDALYPEILSNVKVSYAFKQGNVNVERAVNAGVYTVTVTVVDNNYQGEATTTFTIHKAQAIVDDSTFYPMTSNLPTSSAVRYGQALKSATLQGGSMIYVLGKSEVYGSFKFVDEDRVLGNASDTPYLVDVVFTPEDTDNYELFYTKIEVKVVKAQATATVSGANFVYGDIITRPVFSTFPQNLKVANTDFERDALGSVLRVGTYLFTAYIDDQNYEGSVEYAITVTKKTVKVAYYYDENVVDRYNVTFGNIYYAKARIVADSLVSEDRINVSEFNSRLLYRYTNVDSGAYTLVPPSMVGNYYVTVSMEDNDYIIDVDESKIFYEVMKAHVTSIEFDPESLSNQIYGQVSVPVIVTTPANVGYVVEFPGYDGAMPTNAGNYQIKVTINDENYYNDTRTGTFTINKKPITIENLKAYSKAYDGLASIEVVGELRGVMRGDEVDLKIIAYTRDNKVNVGAHSVVIHEWKLSGLHADNYNVREPLYNLTANITNKFIKDPNTDSYITSPGGFSSNVTVDFTEVYDTIDKTNWFTRMLGQKVTVQRIEVMENGLNTVLDSKVKFYVRIPDEYLDAENLTVVGLGNLSDAIITREGDYVTFYADSSGEITFYKNDFPYWIVPVSAVVLMVVLGAVLALIVLPIRKRKRIPADARKAYHWNEGLEGREHAYKKKVEKEIVEKKRRWRY